MLTACPELEGDMYVRSLSGTQFNYRGTQTGLRAWKSAAKKFVLPLPLLLLAASASLAQGGTQAPTPLPPKDSSQSASAAEKATPPPQAPAQNPLPAPTPLEPGTSTQDHSSESVPRATGTPAESVLPAPTKPAHKPFPSLHGALPAANIPALEARVGFSTLTRTVLYKGLTASVTKQYSDRLGGTIEVSYLRASNVFGTGQTNDVLTYLIGPVAYPFRRDGLVTSVHALGGGGRVSGVATLLPNSAGFVKGTVDSGAWVLGGGVEKWFFSDAMALRVNADLLRTSFFNSTVKVRGEYALRTTWGVVYYFGLRRREGKLGNVAGKELE